MSCKTADAMQKEGWLRVSFAADCLGGDEGEPGDECSLCGCDYADCECPGPTQDGYEYEESSEGVLMARATGGRDGE